MINLDTIVAGNIAFNPEVTGFRPAFLSDRPIDLHRLTVGCVLNDNPGSRGVLIIFLITQLLCIAAKDCQIISIKGNYSSTYQVDQVCGIS